jgi:hypothetical protein
VSWHQPQCNHAGSYVSTLLEGKSVPAPFLTASTMRRRFTQMEGKSVLAPVLAMQGLASPTMSKGKSVPAPVLTASIIALTVEVQSRWLSVDVRRMRWRLALVDGVRVMCGRRSMFGAARPSTLQATSWHCDPSGGNYRCTLRPNAGKRRAVVACGKCSHGAAQLVYTTVRPKAAMLRAVPSFGLQKVEKSEEVCLWSVEQVAVWSKVLALRTVPSCRPERRKTRWAQRRPRRAVALHRRR